MDDRSTPFFVYPAVHGQADARRRYVLLHSQLSRWLVVNGATVDIAKRLSQGDSPDSIAAALAECHGVPLWKVRQDVNRVWEEVMKQEFLHSLTYPPIRIPECRTLFLCITSKCNLYCSHCYVSCSSSRDLPSSHIRTLIDDFVTRGGELLTLSGGEPLLHGDFKALVADAAKKTDVCILTNGTLLDRECAEFLAQSGRVSIQISLDGSTAAIHDALRGKGNFRRSLAGMEHLRRAGLAQEITIATTITRHNFHDLQNMITLAKELSVQAIRFIPLQPLGRAVDSWARLGKDLSLNEYGKFFDRVINSANGREHPIRISCGLSGLGFGMGEQCRPDDAWCQVGRQLAIDIDGDAYPCSVLTNAEFRLGNLFRDGLMKLLENKFMTNMCQTLAERRVRIASCAQCIWRNLCQGGCMAHAFNEQGTVWDADAFCNYRKKTYAAIFDRILTNPYSHNMAA